MADEQKNTEDKGLAQAPAPRGLGKKQKEEVQLASTDDLLKGADPLEGQEGVGNVKVYTNPALGDAVELNSYDENGNVTSSQTFKRGKLHLVTEELANSDLFVRADDNE
jgi:hypothetical protein